MKTQKPNLARTMSNDQKTVFTAIVYGIAKNRETLKQFYGRSTGNRGEYRLH